MGQTNFEFRGSGLGYFWLALWTTVLTIITGGLFFPWAISAQKRWQASNTFIGGRQLRFCGTGLSFLWQWILISVFTVITLGIYIPWAVCRVYRWVAKNTMFEDEVPPKLLPHVTAS